MTIMAFCALVAVCIVNKEIIFKTACTIAALTLKLLIIHLIISDNSAR